jgi:hypothetical protein
MFVSLHGTLKNDYNTIKLIFINNIVSCYDVGIIISFPGLVAKISSS